MEGFLCQKWETLSSPGSAGFTKYSQSAISRWGWDFHTVRGDIDTGNLGFRPRSLEL